MTYIGILIFYCKEVVCLVLTIDVYFGIERTLASESRLSDKVVYAVGKMLMVLLDVYDAAHFIEHGRRHLAVKVINSNHFSCHWLPEDEEPAVDCGKKRNCVELEGMYNCNRGHCARINKV